MYSLQIRFKLLNKSCNRQELSDNLKIGHISIMSDEQSPFSVIIQGYRSEEAQKTVDEIRAGKRRMIEYLLSPVMKYLNESMRERWR